MTGFVVGVTVGALAALGACGVGLYALARTVLRGARVPHRRRSDHEDALGARVHPHQTTWPQPEIEA